MNPPFYTIGHSNRPFAEFVRLLEHCNVTSVADVRKIPHSRANPQYNLETLCEELARSHISYTHISALGGRRGSQPKMNSRNALWENVSFRNYADYAMTPEFQDGFAQLRAMGRREPTAIMCAEAVWWRCHRRIITDYLLAAGETVFHILGPGPVQPAKMTPGAHQEEHILVYAQKLAETPSPDVR